MTHSWFGNKAQRESGSGAGRHPKWERPLLNPASKIIHWLACAPRWPRNIKDISMDNAANKT
jgi:hypothetical protein